LEGKDIRQDGVIIKLDKERRLIFDLNALCTLEDEYGSVDKAFEAISKNNKMKDIRHVLCLALQNEDDSMTEKQAGKLINIQNMKYVVGKLTETMIVSTPEGDGKQKTPSKSGGQQAPVGEVVEHK